ncbi:TRAP transporter small permease [Nisaea acidiphila]|uniref:TRAP transporter small permease protein n=1 Tax=Nisaea acidiphila TaxID=1862145 RepID=A0A9J7AUG3_9PROT|nr:TRAP transporter small permease [Nisaea acidiphila]UUX50967.1 TRAP transporter small permease [Nisaea acidiphila]
MSFLSKVLDLSETVLAVACSAAFAAMFVLGIATVVFRFVIESSLAFPDELIRYLFVWMIFLGSAVAFRRNMHAAIGLVVSSLPTVLRRGALILSSLLSGVFFAMLFYYGVGLTVRVQEQISPALEISMSWVYGAIPAGMAFLIVYAAELILRLATAPADELLAEGL